MSHPGRLGHTYATIERPAPRNQPMLKWHGARFMGKPNPAMIEHRPQDDALNVTSREPSEIVVFVMNLIERYGRDPGEYREELRRILLSELSAWAGTEWLGGD